MMSLSVSFGKMVFKAIELSPTFVDPIAACLWKSNATANFGLRQASRESGWRSNVGTPTRAVAAGPCPPLWSPPPLVSWPRLNLRETCYSFGASVRPESVQLDLGTAGDSMADSTSPSSLERLVSPSTGPKTLGPHRNVPGPPGHDSGRGGVVPNSARFVTDRVEQPDSKDVQEHHETTPAGHGAVRVRVHGLIIIGQRSFELHELHAQAETPPGS